MKLATCFMIVYKKNDAKHVFHFITFYFEFIVFRSNLLLKCCSKFQEIQLHFENTFVSNKFAEWYNKNTKTKCTWEILLLVFEILATRHKILLTRIIKLLEIVRKSFYINRVQMCTITISCNVLQKHYRITLILMRQFLTQYDVAVLKHSPYCAELVPTDFFFVSSS